MTITLRTLIPADIYRSSFRLQLNNSWPTAFVFTGDNKTVAAPLGRILGPFPQGMSQEISTQRATVLIMTSPAPSGSSR